MMSKMSGEAINEPVTTNVPALRFGEFEGAWEEKRLGDVGRVTTGSTPDTFNKSYYNGEKQFVTPADIDFNRYVMSTKTTLTEAGFCNARKAPKNSVLFVCIGSTIGKVAQAFEECTTNQQINAITANDDFENDFIFSLLEHKAKKIKLLAGVQAVPQINKTDFSRIKYFFPCLKEQQKIANFLSAVDSKLNTLEKTHAALNRYKRGLMQQLFSQAHRFKDDNGQDFPDWLNVEFGRLVVKSSQKYNPLNTDDNYLSVELDCLESQTGRLINTYPAINQKSIKTAFKQGDVLFGKLRPNLKKYYYAEFDGVCSSEIWVFRGKKVTSLFLYYLVQTDRFFFACNKTTGSKMPRADWQFVGEFPFAIPILKEQQKIAQTLSTLDNKITAAATKITQLKTFKKGLLQQMFV
jgi:type I restriction enzyme, S subunit